MQLYKHDLRDKYKNSIKTAALSTKYKNVFKKIIPNIFDYAFVILKIKNNLSHLSF